MKYYLHLCLIVSIAFSLSSCFPKPPVKYNDLSSRYDDDLEEGEEKIAATYQKLFSRRADTYILRTYFPETKTLVRYEEFADERRTINQGNFRSYSDDGAIRRKGQYLNGEKIGLWTTFYPNGEIREEGNYANNVEIGEWSSYNLNGTISAKYSYVKGDLDGVYLDFDSTGQQLDTFYYKLGVAVTKDGQPTYEKRFVEKMPSFPGCENLAGTPEYKTCADRKMLEFIYSNVRYPARARQFGVEGLAVVSFIVEKDGRITAIKSVRGVSQDIRAEVFRIVGMMPTWYPGEQDGEVVRVQFNLPVRFKLE